LDSCWSECQNVKWKSRWIPKQLQLQDICYVQEAMYEGWAIWATRCVLKCVTILAIGLFDELFCFCSILFVVSRVVIYHVSDELAIVLEVGDNFTVNAKERNDEGASFWLILCTKPLHKVKAPFINNWGNIYEEGDDVVEGLYYQKWGNNDNSYVFLKDSHKVYVYSHLVKVVKFLMPPKNHKVIGNHAIYELPEETL